MTSSESTLTIAISGSSGAGKTSLTALLKQILPSRTVYIHADAFSKEFEDLPEYNGVLDADSRNSVNFDALKATIDHVKQFGIPSDGYNSFDFIENDLQKSRDRIRPEFLQSMKAEVERAEIDWARYRTIMVVDGFLLYHDPELRERFDLKILLRTTKNEAAQRRFGRYGEKEVPEGSEEFWKTRSYFHECVWRNYALEHAFLFPKRDVEATVEPSDNAGLGIRIQPVLDQSLEETQSWAVRSLVKAMTELE